MSQFYNNAIFWVEVDKIKPNPFQPRKEFDETKLADLARSIRQYGVIQPLTVTRKEVEKDDGGLATEYELIAGERRLRAAKIAGVSSVPGLIRAEACPGRAELVAARASNSRDGNIMRVRFSLPAPSFLFILVVVPSEADWS